MNRSTLAAAALLAACGSAPDDQKAKGPDPCQLAQADLAARLAPEFDRVVTGRRLALAPPGGCALVYLQKDEEFAGEVAEEGGGFGVVDQLLAVALPDGTGKLVLNLVGSSAMATGPVLLTLDGADVDGDGTDELVVQEASGDYQGLRIFLLPAGAQEPVEVFSDHLKVKTPEGLDIAARWSTGTSEGAKTIVLDGAGTKKIYSWNRSEKKFVYDDAATQAARPKAPPPAAPEAPISAPASAVEKAEVEDQVEKVVEKAPKKAKGKKKGEKAAEKKEEKSDTPLPDLGL